MKKSILITMFVYLIGAFNAAQADRPECEYAASDEDGDGYGFEYGQTCLVTENSSRTGTFPTEAVCVDDNADGWGWDGTQSCRVPIEATTCVDTDPVGDGWGWDGATSCRVVPDSTPFNEITELNKHFGYEHGLPIFREKAVGIYCGGDTDDSADDSTTYLLYNGQMVSENGSRGAWTTGLSLTDGRVRIFFTTFRQPDPYLFRLEGDQVMRNEKEYSKPCEWLVPQ